MIELEHISVRYGGLVAVSDLSLTVHDGECVALVGPSGSGKTSALRVMNGMVKCSAGNVSVDGRAFYQWELPVLRRKMGYVIQDVGLLPHWTVERNVCTVPAMLGWSKAEMAARARSLLAQVGLEESLLRRLPAELSGGQRQRVGIARALAAKPRWLLMDEPFGAVDPLTRAQLRDLLLKLRAAHELTTVMVTHDLEDAFALADRIAVLRDGKLAQLGSPEDLRSDPRDDWMQAFIAAGTRSSAARPPPREA